MAKLNIRREICLDSMDNIMICIENYLINVGLLSSTSLSQQEAETNTAQSQN